MKQSLFKLKKIILIADHREKEIIEKLRDLGIEVIEKDLAVGDFVCSSSVCIERKTARDFYRSITDGRIFNQVKELEANYEIPILLIEGDLTLDKMVQACLAKLCLGKLKMLQAKDAEESASLIYWIARKEQEEERKGISFVPKRKPKDLKELQEFILSSFPGISRIKAKRLLARFGSLKNVLLASENRLKKVNGIGEKLAQKIKKLIEAKYK